MDMAYVEGAFVPLAEARVSVLDRGFLFGDGVYEVVAVLDGGLVDLDAHMARLGRSLDAVGIGWPLRPARVEELHRTLAARSGMREGLIYLQITRGAAPERDFVPRPDAAPALVMFTHARAVAETAAARDGIAVATVPDLRWARRDIKSVALLAQVLAKREAASRGCQEAWMVQDGMVTEGGSSTAFIVSGREIVTRMNSSAILPGCTRRAVQALAEERGIDVQERPFSVAEAQAADEAFITSATSLVTPVVRIDDAPVADGRPGTLTRRLREMYLQFARESVLKQKRSAGVAA